MAEQRIQATILPPFDPPELGKEGLGGISLPYPSIQSGSTIWFSTNFQDRTKATGFSTALALFQTPSRFAAPSVPG